MIPKPNLASPTIVLLIAILAASTAAIFIRFAQTGMPSLVIAAGRLSIASIILTVIVLPTRWHEIMRLNKRQIRLMVLSGFFLAFHFAGWVSSLGMTSVVSSVVLVATTPLWVSLLSPLVLREKINKQTAIGMVIALVGTVLVGGSDLCDVQTSGFSCADPFQELSTTGIMGNLLALFGAWCAAFYLLIGRSVRSSVSLPIYTWVVYGTAAIILLGMVLFSGLPITGYSWNMFIWILALAVIPQLIGHSLFNWSLKYVPAAFVAVALLGEPVTSTILAVIFLGEMPGILEIAGGVVILIGIYVSSRNSS